MRLSAYLGACKFPLRNKNHLKLLQQFNREKEVWTAEDFQQLQFETGLFDDETIPRLDVLVNGTAEDIPEPDFLYHNSGLKIIVAYATMIIGLPANILILFVTACNWRSKSASSWLVLNLTIADLCLIPTAFFSIRKIIENNRSIDGSLRFPQLQDRLKIYSMPFF